MEFKALEIRLSLTPKTNKQTKHSHRVLQSCHGMSLIKLIEGNGFNWHLDF